MALTVKDFAKTLKISDSALLERMQNAGLSHSKNTDEITWMNKVHETITGYDTFSNFPAEETWCLYHPKQIDRQEKQNKFYETI